MKLMDKLKNALFEEEYVEIEERPKPKKEHKKEKVVKEKRDKPIAKKIAVAEKKEIIEPIFEDEEEEQKAEQKAEVIKERELLKSESEFRFPVMAEEDFSVNTDIIDESNKAFEVNDVIDVREERPLYQASKQEKKDNFEYEELSKKEYGLYEKKQERNGFKPSPIISPIYGVLDKNYKKEEVKEKKEVRISSFSREDLDLDAVRNKAYGDLTAELEELPVKEIEPEEVEEDNLLVDLSDEEAPSVNKVTVGDALEYFEDLGLEYNTDYIDASKEKATGRRVKEVEEDDEEKPISKKEVEEDNENLFDLIDSMYSEE